MTHAFRFFASVVSAMLLTVGTVARADVTTVIGGGTVASTSAINGAATFAQGFPAGFSVTFDPATAIQTFVSAMQRVYIIRPTAFIAGIGPHQLNIDPANPGWAILAFQSAFINVGGPVSEAALVQTFQFTGTGGGTSPVFLGPSYATRDFLQFTSIFRNGTTAPATTIDNFRDPATAFRNTFAYRGDNGTNTRTTPIGSAFGQWTGAVVPTLGAVPEPGTWLMLILGFGTVGGAMRRRTARPGRSTTATTA